MNLKKLMAGLLLGAVIFPSSSKAGGGTPPDSNFQVLVQVCSSFVPAGAMVTTYMMVQSENNSTIYVTYPGGGSGPAHCEGEPFQFPSPPRIARVTVEIDTPNGPYIYRRIVPIAAGQKNRIFITVNDGDIVSTENSANGPGVSDQ